MSEEGEGPRWVTAGFDEDK